jgi:chromosome segregation ATPase
MANETLSRDKAKTEDECRSLKQELDALKARFHDIDVENRKLAHDREELARAYKDTDSAKLKAEGRVRELEDELKKLRADADHRLNAQNGEAMTMKKKLTMEIESLTVRLQETESRLRNEVEKIKKKMSVTIAELEMSLDASNKANVQLQNSSKAQVTKIMELTTIIDKTTIKLNESMGQLDGTSKRLVLAEGELGNTKKSFGQMLNEKKMFESKLTELSSKITEITNINVNLTSVKVKLEKDLSMVSANYEDMARELKLADDRANKAGNDAQHFEGLLREESVKVQKIDNVKKALESEVKNLTIRMEEIETTAVTSSKRTIQKNGNAYRRARRVLVQREGYACRDNNSFPQKGKICQRVAPSIRRRPQKYINLTRVSRKVEREDQNVQASTRRARGHFQLKHYEGQKVPKRIGSCRRTS